MHLFNLPEEVLIIVIRLLDTKSIINLYNTCKYIRNIVCMNGVTRVCNMCLSTLATRDLLKSHFFIDVSRHLRELNMCGVSDLTKSILMPSLKKLKNLRTLNISYTKINMCDLVGLELICPTLRNFTVNFTFNDINVSPELLDNLQNTFKNLENVHFVGSIENLMISGLPSYILEYATLNKLTFTITETNGRMLGIQRLKKITSDAPNFKQFYIYVLNSMDGTHDLTCIQKKLLKHVVNMHLEYLIITILKSDEYAVHCSISFDEFIKVNYGLQTKRIVNVVEDVKDGITNISMVWKKEFIFDDKFFSNLLKSLNQYFPKKIRKYNHDKLDVGNSYFIVKITDSPNINDNYEPPVKRKVAKNLLLNYDELFEHENNVQLKIKNDDLQFRHPITLSTSSQFLVKLTYLNLAGHLLYSKDFFSILFNFCRNLETLNVESTPATTPCSLLMANFIPFSSSLKNFRIVDKRINFNLLLSSLAKCTTLENVIIHDSSNEFNNETDPGVIIKECRNMYHFYIYASMSENARKIMLRQCEKAKIQYKMQYLYAHIVNRQNNNIYNYYPFMNVFRPTIKIQM